MLAGGRLGRLSSRFSDAVERRPRDQQRGLARVRGKAEHAVEGQRAGVVLMDREAEEARAPERPRLVADGGEQPLAEARAARGGRDPEVGDIGARDAARGRVERREDRDPDRAAALKRKERPEGGAGPEAGLP